MLILGILAAAGPQTPYSIKQIVGRSVGHYWPFPHAQIYAETARLAAIGFAVEEQEVGGLRRKRYALTPEGRAAFDAWLAEPAAEPPQYRDLGLLKLAFGSLASAEARRALRDHQVAAHDERLRAYERFVATPMDAFLRATLELGLRYERAALEFWRALSLDVGDGPDRSAG
ncbi:MAG TPA: helix-turn-helix transcriptional regulator [Candidatus Limnocylindrales bacterium]